LACIFGVSGEKQRFCWSAASDNLYYDIMRSVRRVRVWRVQKASLLPFYGRKRVWQALMSRNEAVHARDFTQKRRASPEGNTAKSAALLEQQMATSGKRSTAT
jgi:hypothetical protein